MGHFDPPTDANPNLFDFLCNIVNVRSYDYWTTVYESGVIAQHISSIVIFIAVFINLEQQKLATNSLIIAGTLMTSLGYIFWDYSVVQTVPSYASKSRTIGHIKRFKCRMLISIL